MKPGRFWLWSVGRTVLGLALVTLLLNRIHHGSGCVVFTVEDGLGGPSVGVGAVYRDAAHPKDRYLVEAVDLNPLRLHTWGRVRSADRPAPKGVLLRVTGTGPPCLRWHARTVRARGLQTLGAVFGRTFRRWPALIGAGMLFGLCLGISACRWRSLLAAQSIALTWPRTMALVFVGHFFNAFFLGSTGGDVIKAWYVAREAPGRKTEAVLSVVLDRAAGLLGLILIAAISAGSAGPVLWNSIAGRSAIGLAGGLLAGAALTLALVGRRALTPAQAGPIPAAHVGGRLRNQLHRAVAACRVLRERSLTLRVLGWSVLNHGLLMVMLILLSWAAGTGLGPVEVLWVGPTINLVGSLPVTPGGLGLREYAAVTYLGLVGVAPEPAMAVSLLVYGTMTLWSLVGGAVFLTLRGPRCKVAQQEASQFG